MLYHEKTKECFTLVAKNGSVATQDYLYALGFKYATLTEKTVIKSFNSQPRELFDRNPFLEEYRFYGIYRNPLDRFVSGLKHLNRVNIKVPLEQIPSLNFQLSFIMEPQVNWLDYPGMTVLDFDDFEQELKRFGSKYEDPGFKVIRANVGVGELIVTEQIKSFVREFYAADYQFAKERLGKVYNE